MGSPFLAYGYLRASHKPEIGIFHIGGIKFKGRKEDWVAIKEVLVDDEYSCIDQIFSKNDAPRIIDLGANIGSFALRAFLTFPKANVVSLEAARDTFEILDFNCQINSNFQWKAMNRGVWSHDGALTLMRRGISSSHRVVEWGGQDLIEGISLQTLTKEMDWETIDLIKMDIEGGEETVIPASLDILKKTQFLIIEIHTDRVDSFPIIKSLEKVYAYRKRINNRLSKKPLYIMTNLPDYFGNVLD